MLIKVTVTGPSGQLVEHEANVTQRGDVTKEVGLALDIYHTLYPDSPPFQHTTKVEHA